MSNFEKLINASDLIEWIIETDPDWCVGSVRSIIDHIDKMPSAEPEIIRCKYCKHWNTGNCNCPDIRVDCSDYYVGDIVTEEDFYCGFAKRREDE